MSADRGQTMWKICESCMPPGEGPGIWSTAASKEASGELARGGHLPAHPFIGPAVPHVQLRSFEITGGIPQTLPRLLELLKPSMEAQQAASEAAQSA